jgi:thymidylate kinase
MQRGQYGEERYEKIDFQLKVREKFMALKAEDEAAGVIPWYTLDARKRYARTSSDEL